MLRKSLTKVVLILFGLEMLIPLVGLFIFSLKSGPHLSFSAYSGLLKDSTFQQALLHSVIISIITILFCIVLFTPPVWYAYMYMPSVVRIIEGISFIPFVLPGVVLGLGYVQFFSNPPFAWAGTPNLLPFAFTLIGMPFYLQAVINRLHLIDTKTYNEASQSLGASRLRSWLQVHMPLLSPGIINGSILVFSISMGEFAITQLTTGGSYMTLAVYLQVLFQSNPVQGSAMAIIALLIAIFAVLLSIVSVAGEQKEV